MIISLAFSLILSFAETTRDAGSPDSGAVPSADVQKVADRFSSLKKCGDKIWPDMLLTQRSITLLDKNGSAWRWNQGELQPINSAQELDHLKKITGKRPYAVNKSKTPNEVVLNLGAGGGSGPSSAPPAAGSSGGKPPAASGGGASAGSPACQAAMDQMKTLNKQLFQPAPLDPLDAAFKLGVHESFHVCDQSDGWKHSLTKQDSSRVNAYPSPIEPRQMRYKLKIALREALKTENPQKRQSLLQEAAYWHREYKNKYGSVEPSANTDLFEGTARYVDLIANKVDCSKPLDSNSFAKLSREAILSGLSEGPEPTMDSESYSLGALAGSLLDQQRNLGWKQKMADQGISSLDQLLSSVTPQKGGLGDTSKYDSMASVNPKLADECYVKPDMEYLKNYTNPDYVWVSVPANNIAGKGAYDASSVLPAKHVNIQASYSTPHLTTKYMPHVLSAANPCGGENSLMVLVRKDSIQSGQVSFTGTGNPPGHVEGQIQDQPQSSSLGPVYCSK